MPAVADVGVNTELVAPDIDVPPVLLAVVLLYHWYVKATPLAVTLNGLKLPLIHTVWVPVD